MKNNRMTVADLRALKGKRQLAMLYVDTPDEARAAAAAGIDLLSIPGPVWTPEMRAAAGNCFVQVGHGWSEGPVTAEDYLRAAHAAIRNGGDAFYCAAGLDTVRALAHDGVPVVGHVGLVPSKVTWTGGFRAVGKTAESALAVWRQVQALEAAGAVGAHIEVVPGRGTAGYAKRTTRGLFSMGGGGGGDAQYLFCGGVVGCTRSHRARHSKVDRDVRAE
jgi:3-methyl-2-oxobutanoate hydroxymethyltransferase